MSSGGCHRTNVGDILELFGMKCEMVEFIMCKPPFSIAHPGEEVSKDSCTERERERDRQGFNLTRLPEG